MNYFALACALSASAIAAVSTYAKEREWWIPGPASLMFGAVADGHLLCYQWEPSGIPDTNMRRSVESAHLVSAEKWIAGEEWEPKDIRWLVVDLSADKVKPLKDAMPHEVAALSLHLAAPFRAWPHHAPHRWRLAWGRFFATKVEEQSGLHPALPASVVVVPLAPRDPATSLKDVFFPHTANETQGTPREIRGGEIRMHFLDDICIRGMPWWAEWRKARGTQLVRVDFDILPTAREQVTVLVLAENAMSAWHFRAQHGAASFGQGQWQRLATFATPFLEPFHAAAAKDTYFLVTDESGEVYAAEQTDGQWKTRMVWKDAARPIIAMLVESDGQTAYVFGKDFYLKLGRDAQPKPCRDVTQGPKDLGDPMRTVYQCGRILYEKGELRKPDAQK